MANQHGYDFSNMDDGVDWATMVPSSGCAFPGHGPPPPPPMTEQEKEMEKLREMNMRAGFIMTFPLPEDVERLPGAGSRARATRAYASGGVGRPAASSSSTASAGPTRPSLEEALREGRARPKPGAKRGIRTKHSVAAASMNKRGPSQIPAALPQFGQGSEWRGERPGSSRTAAPPQQPPAPRCTLCAHPETRFCPETGAPHPSFVPGSPASALPSTSSSASHSRRSVDQERLTRLLTQQLLQTVQEEDAMAQLGGGDTGAAAATATPPRHAPAPGATPSPTYHNGDAVEPGGVGGGASTPPPRMADTMEADARLARALSQEVAARAEAALSHSPASERGARAVVARGTPPPPQPRGSPVPSTTPRRLGAESAPFATGSGGGVGRRPAGATRNAATGEWELTDFSYENLLELGTMAVSTGLSKAQLGTMKPLPYAKPAGGDVLSEDCIICLETLEEGDPSLRIVCKHVFHHSCILEWLKKTNRCPTCRREIPRKEKLVK